MQNEMDMRLARLAKRRVGVRYNDKTLKFEVYRGAPFAEFETIDAAVNYGETNRAND